MASNQGPGMLGELFSRGMGLTRREDIDDQARLERQANMDGFGADRLATYQGAEMAGKGLGTVAAIAAGKDPRSPAQRDSDAIQAAKAQVSQLGFNPDDPKSIDEFYKRVVQILQQQGLAAEALAVSKEWSEQKRKDTETDLKNQDLQRKVSKDANADALGWARLDQLAQNGIKAGSAVGKILSDMDLDINKTPERRAYLKQALDNVLDKGWQAVDLGDKIELRSKVGGKVIDTSEKGLTPRDDAKKDAKAEASANAYNQALLALQRQYDAAVELYNMRGVKGMTGRFGRWVGEPDKGLMNQIATLVSPNDARAAFSKHEQVAGGAFLSGLAVLKRASATGATGLGAVSEKEGDKVQADAAALNRMQEAPDYRKQLATYIRYIEAYANELAAGAKQDGADVRTLQQRALTGGVTGKPTAVAPTAPAAAAPEAPASVSPADETVRVLDPKGRPGRIPRANLDRALKQGYKEAP